MRKVFIAGLFTIAAGSVILNAQVVTTSKIAFDMSAPTLAEAQGYVYKVYRDSAATGVVLAGVTCTAGVVAGQTCEAPFPAFTPGAHTLTVTASNAAGDESNQSAALSFTFVVKPGTPAGLRVK